MRVISTSARLSAFAANRPPKPEPMITTRLRAMPPLSQAITRRTQARGCDPCLGLRSLLEELAGHDHALDLVGALVDLGDLGVAHHALDREVAGVAVAPEQLHRVGRDLHRGVGRERL